MTQLKLKSGLYRFAYLLKPVLPHGILANLEQWVRAYAHEPDFEVFDVFENTDALVLDVGASRGQSALSILSRTKHIRVFSVEPNTRHRWSLIFIALLYPTRFRFGLFAAGAEPADATLYIPGKRASGLSAQASLDPLEFEKDYVQARLAKAGFDAANKSGFRSLGVRVRPLDQLALSPQMIKLDVEGFESQALRGLEQTLKAFYPVILIEVNNRSRWLQWLSGLGYDFYRYDPHLRCFEPVEESSRVLNLFCIHPDGTGAVSLKLQQMIRP